MAGRGWECCFAFLAGAWLVCGWAFSPVWAGGEVHPFGHLFARGLRWLGHLERPGGLVLLFTGATQGLLMRATMVEQAPPQPAAPTQLTTPE